MKNLVNVSEAEQRAFFDSFDDIWSDVDGVIWLFQQKFPGAPEAVKSLKKIGKTFRFVSNNILKSYESYVAQLREGGFEEELLTPAFPIAEYFTSRNFDKEIYVLSMSFLKDFLRKEGLKIAEDGPDRVSENIKDMLYHILDNENVGAVVIDADVNLNYVKLQKAVTYLKRPDVEFVLGATDAKAPVTTTNVLIGPWYFQNAVMELTGRKPKVLSKPSPLLRDYIVRRYNISDQSRVLFIGDSVPADMGFAVACGWKKLLVLSGLTRPHEIENWTYPEELRPEYYVHKLSDLNGIIAKLYGTLDSKI